MVVNQEKTGYDPLYEYGSLIHGILCRRSAVVIFEQLPGIHSGDVTSASGILHFPVRHHTATDTATANGWHPGSQEDHFFNSAAISSGSDQDDPIDLPNKHPRHMRAWSSFFSFSSSSLPISLIELLAHHRTNVLSTTGIAGSQSDFQNPLSRLVNRDRNKPISRQLQVHGILPVEFASKSMERKPSQAHFLGRRANH